MSRIGYLKVYRTTFPPISADGLKEERQKIWSTNTGRTVKGKMVGTIVATKWKLEVSYKVLTKAQVQAISNVMDSKTEWHDIEFYSVTEGRVVSFKGYFGDSAYPVYGTNINGDVLVTGLSFSIIEQ
jgi:hypothetical protein